jgi:SAM-dependent methyltransferase
VRASVEAAPLASESFDFVWSRFLFEYLSEPDVATRELVRLLKPGGKLALGDLDNMAQIHFPMSPELAAGLGVLREALDGRVDLFAGRKLYSRMQRAGLGSLKAHIFPYHVYAGEAPGPDVENWATKLRVIGPLVQEAFGGVAAYSSFCAEFMRHLTSDEVFSYAVLVVVEGRKVRS